MPNAPAQPLVSRLTGALGVSIGLHAVLLLGAQALPQGQLQDSLSFFEAHAAPLHAAANVAQVAAPAASGAAPALAPLRAADYLPTNKLDVRPGIKTRVEPEYPERAARRFLSGTVRIRLFISERGTVDRVMVVKADPAGFFEESAERAFRAARFSPGMKGGRAVKVQMLLEVTYESPDAPKVPGKT